MNLDNLKTLIVIARVNTACGDDMPSLRLG